MVLENMYTIIGYSKSGVSQGPKLIKECMNETEKGVGGREKPNHVFFFAVFCSRVSVIQYKDRADKDRLYL